MLTVTVQIGNSDDKLSQKEWAAFVRDWVDMVTLAAEQVHFSGASHPAAPFQNACIVFEIEREDLGRLEKGLTVLRDRYRQDSVAICVSPKTRFI